MQDDTAPTIRWQAIYNYTRSQRHRNGCQLRVFNFKKGNSRPQGSKKNRDDRDGDRGRKMFEEPFFLSPLQMSKIIGNSTRKLQMELRS